MNSSGMRTCLDKWINSTVLIPIYDTLSSKPSGDNLAYHIVGLAAFVLTAREQPAVDQIQGYFVVVLPAEQRARRDGWTPPSPDDISTPIGLVK